jgi:hypothetical protein
MAPEFGKPIHQLPLLPANILKKHRVHEPLDPRFRAAARLLLARQKLIIGAAVAGSEGIFYRFGKMAWPGACLQTQPAWHIRASP